MMYWILIGLLFFVSPLSSPPLHSHQAKVKYLITRIGIWGDWILVRRICWMKAQFTMVLSRKGRFSSVLKGYPTVLLSVISSAFHFSPVVAAQNSSTGSPHSRNNDVPLVYDIAPGNHWDSFFGTRDSLSPAFLQSGCFATVRRWATNMKSTGQRRQTMYDGFCER